MDADKKRIWIRGQFVEVTEEVYRAYMQGDRKMRYFENDLKTERFVLGKEGQVRFENRAVRSRKGGPSGADHPQPRRFFGPAGG